jgi:hypothetical protein
MCVLQGLGPAINISKDDMINLASNIYNVVFASTSVQPKLKVRKSSKDKYFRVQKPRTKPNCFQETIRTTPKELRLRKGGLGMYCNERRKY